MVEGVSKAKYLLCEDLGERRSKAEAILRSCALCERRCNADRKSGERGYCGVLESRISSEFVHFGEEPELVPSYTVFFAGCTFKCVFCQNWDISQRPDNGLYIPPETLAKMIEKTSGINVNWVGGDPTSNLAYILAVLFHLRRSIPQVWNSNMYLSVESMALLDGIIDLYLTDFKYGNDKCGKKLSNAPDYWRITTRNHLLAHKQADVIIRHLILPGHVDCCTKPIIEWIGEHMPKARVNLMDQYRPEYKAKRIDGLMRGLTSEEYGNALEYAGILGLDLVG